ncbi:hypothetical protein BKM31_43425 [[Actinomadura] parvosata subsp. kistnae]|uniref:Uncharacterized protein n=1 Tax=[Actinomadura] parvosata subsp. kistnae TaxID=1909395 RepID=A0A1V0AB58_9ACTN|nr:hypothetical protein [Nonomuraea sp. ATCC 55076]AQZ67409.1 hypothetical protein BKM31_43425 [Nonomuraea sp. ATCC 55076]
MLPVEVGPEHLGGAELGDAARGGDFAQEAFGVEAGFVQPGVEQLDRHEPPVGRFGLVDDSLRTLAQPSEQPVVAQRDRVTGLQGVRFRHLVLPLVLDPRSQA